LLHLWREPDPGAGWFHCAHAVLVPMVHRGDLSGAERCRLSKNHTSCRMAVDRGNAERNAQGFSVDLRFLKDKAAIIGKVKNVRNRLDRTILRKL
jgi:hypothetical protein